MAYIGKEPTTGNFVYADDITTSATNTYNILVGGVAFSPESANHLIVSLNGVIQKANTSFSVSGSQITFIPSSGTLSSSDSIDFILILGSVNDVGVATTVSDSAITKSKLNLISTSGSPGLEVKGDGSSENGTIQLNCSQNSHGIKLSSPDHSAGQSYELIFPTGNVTADKVLKVASVSGSGSTGIGQLSFGDAGGVNTPSFLVTKTSNQSISNTTNTLVTWQQEVNDSDNAFASNKFTVPSGKGGLYFLNTQLRFNSMSDGNEIQIAFKKNGAYEFNDGNANQYIVHNVELGGAASSYFQNTAMVNLSASDYIEVAVYHNNGGSRDINYTYSRFSGFKIIT